MPQGTFSTNEAVSLEKVIDLNIKPAATTLEELEKLYELEKCAEWIKSNKFQTVCLQFPDHLLVDSTQVALRLQNSLQQTVYVLGDTAYESCCIDYIAAAHISADAIIHFGPTCLSKSLANIPYLYIYEKCNLNVDKLKSEVNEKLEDKIEIILLIDTPYFNCLDTIQKAFERQPNISICRLDGSDVIPKLKFLLFIGNDERKMMNIEFLSQPQELYYFHDGVLRKHEISLTVLKKRNYLVEKIRDSKTIGIVVGTLSIKNYLKVIDRLKKLISLNGKKYYLISVGKPTVAKLANFPELDVYVVVTCSQSEIFESREFYKPIVTPYDIEIALNAAHNKNIKFSYDFNNFLEDDLDNENLSSKACDEGDVSLLTNRVRGNEVEEVNLANPRGNNQIALRSDGTLSLNTSYGAGYLADRTWKGLEQNLGQTEVEMAQEGRSGFAQKYNNEEV